jgi:hypothetical protein
MRENRAIAAFAFWKRANKLQDAVPKLKGLRENVAELENDRIHFPETVVKVDMQQRFADAQMRG